MIRALFGARWALSTNSRCLSAAAAAAKPKVDKEALKTLRQRTGYSYVNCKKALEKFGPQSLSEAEEWLRELAKKEGWAKAAKLSSRQANNGLVGTVERDGVAAVVELSCETDFVERGEPFRQLLAELTSAVLEHGLKQEYWPSPEPGRQLASLHLTFDELVDKDGRSLRSILTEAVGRIGENLNVKSAHVFKAPEGTQLFAATHPKDAFSSVSMGHFASVLVLRRLSSSPSLFPTDRLAHQLCQHVIGMRSERVGEPPEIKEPVVEEKQEKKKKSEEDELNDFFEGATTSVDESETSLLRQSFMLSPSMTVHEYLTKHEAQVLDFARIQLAGAGDD